MSVEQILSETPNLVLDTGVLLGYLMDESQNINSLLEKYVFNRDSKINLYGHNLIRTELFYIICRERDVNEAERVLNQIEGIMNIISDTWLFKKAAIIKCRFPIAISDCFSISLAILQESPVFFLSESEISEEIVDTINKEYNVEVKIV